MASPPGRTRWVKLLLDVHHSRVAAERLRADGYDVQAAADDPELAALPDEELLRRASSDRPGRRHRKRQGLRPYRPFLGAHRRTPCRSDLHVTTAVSSWEVTAIPKISSWHSRAFSPHLLSPNTIGCTGWSDSARTFADPRAQRIGRPSAIDRLYFVGAVLQGTHPPTLRNVLWSRPEGPRPCRRPSPSSPPCGGAPANPGVGAWRRWPPGRPRRDGAFDRETRARPRRTG